MDYNKRVSKLTKVCNEVLRIAKQYSYLWDADVWDEDEFNKGRYLGLYWGFIAQDESFSIDIERVGKKFAFNGKNFGGYDSDGLTGRDAAEAMISLMSGITPENLKKGFYSALKKPLGKYLAKKEIERLEGLGEFN